jgi:hypothetical protein
LKRFSHRGSSIQSSGGRETAACPNVGKGISETHWMSIFVDLQIAML